MFIGSFIHLFIHIIIVIIFVVVEIPETAATVSTSQKMIDRFDVNLTAVLISLQDVDRK